MIEDIVTLPFRPTPNPVNVNLLFSLTHSFCQLNPERTKTILKRIPNKELDLGMLYIGSAVTIYSRQYHIIDVADQGTRNKFGTHNGKAFGLIKPESRSSCGSILSAIRANGFTVAELKSVWSEEHGGLCTAVLAASSNSSTDGAVEKFARIVGGGGGVYCSQTADDVVSDSAMYFGENSVENSSVGDQECTLCLIKPHVIQDGKLGEMISAIQSDFTVASMQMFYLDRNSAVEFYDVYRGVLPQYAEMVNHLIEGPVVALQLVGQNVVEDFREFCGPVNVELAKILRPKTLRSVYGSCFAKNAVHATDLSEDGGLEVKFFFDILAHI